MLDDGRLVAARHMSPGISEYAYWLCLATDTPRREVADFRDWIMEEVKGDTDGRASQRRKTGRLRKVA